MATNKAGGSEGDEGGRCDDCGGVAETRDGDDYRCACGSLLGRIVPGGVELKCRRCKRTFVLPIETEAAM